MKKKTIISILCTVCWFFAAYAAYAYIYFGWLSATPLSGSQLKRVHYDAIVWLAILGFSIIAATLLAWWKSRMAGCVGGEREEPPAGEKITLPIAKTF